MLAALPDERYRIILDRLGRDGRVLAATLAAEFGLSEDTVRRDLRELAAAGKCRRVYGGALPLSAASNPLHERLRENTDAKDALGRAAAGLVEPRQVVFIDAGSTNLAIARALPDDAGLTVVTNAPAIAAALADRAGTVLIVIGGRIDPRIGAATGGRAMAEARDIRADIAFLGACAIDATGPVCAFDVDETEFKRAMVQASRTVAAAVTTDKLGTTAPFAIMPARELDFLVVEPDAPIGALAPLETSGVAIVRATAGKARS